MTNPEVGKSYRHRSDRDAGKCVYVCDRYCVLDYSGLPLTFGLSSFADMHLAPPTKDVYLVLRRYPSTGQLYINTLDTVDLIRTEITPLAVKKVTIEEGEFCDEWKALQAKQGQDTYSSRYSDNSYSADESRGLTGE